MVSMVEGIPVARPENGFLSFVVEGSQLAIVEKGSTG